MIELCCEYFSVHCIWLYVIIMSYTSFWVSLLYIVCLNIKDFLARSRHHILSLIYSNRIRTHNHLVRKQMLKPSVRPAKNDLVVLWVLICTAHLAVSSYHVTYEFQSESTLNSLPECQRTPLMNQVLYLKFQWKWQVSNSQWPTL